MWAHAPWRGTFFTREARREDFLPQYAGVFDTSEGNSTFYGLPTRETVARWAAEAPATFRFCLKFPRAITHDLQLVGAAAATAEFLDRTAPLGERLGPFFLQLHASFGPARRRDLEALLADCGVERVNFDTRGLFASAATDEFTRDAQRKKPRVQLRTTALTPRPFVRFVGDPEIARNAAILDAWADTVARWLTEGRSPYFFTHHPDDAWAPALARDFQRRVRARTPAVPEPAEWPAERERPPEQLSLL